MRIPAFLLGLSSLLPALGEAVQDPPSILLVLADDMGYSDPGCYGGEIATPSLDRLAAGGIRLSQFYNTGRCWPTRGSLLTGYYAQQIRRDRVPGISPSGGQGKRPAWAPLLPRRLEKAGYRSYHSGKWHIDGMPLENGFDRSYYLRDQGRFFHPRDHWEDDVRLPPVEPGGGYYATVAIADHAIRILQEHARDHPDRPFFHYLAFTAPHFPLHALPRDSALYRESYLAGWEAVRKARRARQLQAGLVPGPLSPVERDLGPPYRFADQLRILGGSEVALPLPWEDLTGAQQAFQAAKMALHAAMVHRIDAELGRILEQLRILGLRENTLVLFLSDNGASAEIMVRSDGHDPGAVPGSAGSYLCLGPGWSTVSNTPFRRHKTWVHEGGIATPLIVSWPRGITSRGALEDQPGHVIDLVPTLMEWIGLEPPSEGPPMPGRSLAGVLQKGEALPPRTLFWAHDGHRALRQGDWKLVAARDRPWELYRMDRDRAESEDLSARRPRRAAAMAALWEETMAEFARQAAGSGSQ